MTWKIPLGKPLFDDAEQQAVKEVLMSGMVSQGERVEEFEEVVRKYVGAKYAVAVSSATAGLYLILLQLLKKHGGELCAAIPAFTFPALNVVMDDLSRNGTIDGIMWDMIDVEENTYNMQTDNENFELQEGLTTLATVHQFGLPCNMKELKKIANENDLDIIEDAACAIGSEYKGKKIGRRGTAVFSFHGRKIITTGEGGIVVTDDEELYKKCFEGRNFGRNKISEFVGTGLNFKMSDIHAAIGIAQIEKLPVILNERARVAESYNEAIYPLEEYELLHRGSTLTRPNFRDYLWSDTKTNWQSYVISGVKNRDEVMRKMRENGIEVQVGSYDNSNGSCEISAKLAKSALALPIFPQMNEEDVKLVVEELERCLQTKEH